MGGDFDGAVVAAHFGECFLSPPAAGHNGEAASGTARRVDPPHQARGDRMHRMVRVESCFAAALALALAAPVGQLRALHSPAGFPGTAPGFGAMAIP